MVTEGCISSDFISAGTVNINPPCTTSVTKSYTCEYAHVVRGAYSTRCKYNIHGHSGKIEVTLSATSLDKSGMVLDFGAMGKIKALVDLFDHATLLWSGESYEVIQFFRKNFKRVIIMKLNTTAENMAATLMYYINNLIHADYNHINVDSVTVHETATGKATCYGYNPDAKILSVNDQEDCDKEFLNMLGLLEVK
jgi:6-pyruvoyltetrahydropterin/6-carboxytetrahydropterin synthase